MSLKVFFLASCNTMAIIREADIPEAILDLVQYLVPYILQCPKHVAKNYLQAGTWFGIYFNLFQVDSMRCFPLLAYESWCMQNISSGSKPLCLQGYMQQIVLLQCREVAFFPAFSSLLWGSCCYYSPPPSRHYGKADPTYITITTDVAWQVAVSPSEADWDVKYEKGREGAGLSLAWCSIPNAMARKVIFVPLHLWHPGNYLGAPNEQACLVPFIWREYNGKFLYCCSVATSLVYFGDCLGNFSWLQQYFGCLPLKMFLFRT